MEFLMWTLFAAGIVLSNKDSVNSPFYLSQVLGVFSLLVAIVSWEKASFWSFMTLIVVFSGGVMVSIMYLSSLMNNEKMNPPYLSTGVFVISVATMSPFCLKIFFYFDPLNSLYHMNMAPMYGYLMTYIFLTLIVVVKISPSFKGALKQL